MRNLEKELRQGVSDLSLDLSDLQITHLLDYLELIQKWTKVYNLTSVRDPAEMLTHHLLDSLAVITPLRRQLSEYKETVEVLEDLCAEIHQGWQQTCVAVDGMLQAIARKWDELLQCLADLFGVPVELIGDRRVPPGRFDEFFSDDWDDSHAFAWSPDFDVDGADAPVLDFDLEED